MTEKTLSKTVARLEALFKNDFNSAGIESDLSKLFDYLVESEGQALALIAYAHHPDGPKPVLPPAGSIEFGFVLYWIHYPPKKFKAWLDQHEVFKLVWEGLKLIAPKTKITTTEYDFVTGIIETKSIPWDDGTLIGTKKYEELDEGWILAALNYVINLKYPGTIHSFPKNTPYQGKLTAKSGKGDPVLAIIGDWGTGFYQDSNQADCPAKRVVDDLQKRQIDYLIHLGDVYYAGTDLRPLPGEENDNFINIWPDQGENRNFTLISNHEMYGDACGYFDQALASNKPFSTQNGMSYFALSYGPWLVLGIDSAYYSDARNGHQFYMDGAIGTDTHTQQIDWLKGFRDHQGPVMVMSHHNPVALTTGFTNELFYQVQLALGKMPEVWYWGHVHNGIVYNQLHIGNADIYVPTKGRCCGHAAIPFGNGWGLEQNSNIPYYAHTPDPTFPNGSPRVLNGYATVILHGDGGFTENFYEVGNENPVWSKKWPNSES